MESLKWMDAMDLAELIRKKELSSEELIEDTICKVEKLNPSLNAINIKMYEDARSAARKNDLTGPFAGVPFLMKDLEAFAGAKYTAGSVFLKDFVSPTDSVYSSRIRNSGLVTIGKTNTCEFGLLPTTEPSLFGPTRNPWNLDYTAGGSSGGAAAAVAAGIVPMAHASDGGGSIRIPASCCGLFGLKVSRGRNPKNPDAIGLSVNHSVSRTVRDSAAFLDATSGSEIGDPFNAPRTTDSYVSEVSKDPGKLKIGFLNTRIDGKKIHPDCVDAVVDAANLLNSLGHEAEEVTLELNVPQYTEAFSILWQTSLAQSINSLSKLLGRFPKENELEPYTWEVFRRGNEVKGVDYLSALTYMQVVTKQMSQFFTKYDLLLTATLGGPPLKIGELTYRGNIEEYVNRLNDWVPYTPLANTTGMPAMSVPLYWNSEGLPIGVHFMGPYGDEATLFRLAGQLEHVRPWRKMYPDIFIK